MLQAFLQLGLILGAGLAAALAMVAVTHRAALRPYRLSLVLLTYMATVWALAIMAMVEDPARWYHGGSTIFLSFGPTALIALNLVRIRRRQAAAVD